MIADGDLDWYSKQKAGDHIVVVSWSGRFFTSGPWRTDYGGCPFPLDGIFKG